VVGARRTYTGRCTHCHGPDGKAETAIGSHIFPPAPDLTSARTQSRTDGALFWIIQNGSPRSGMPGWKETLDAEEIWQLVSYCPAASQEAL
jgi:mono/diheme cytochrome c family protein